MNIKEFVNLNLMPMIQLFGSRKIKPNVKLVKTLKLSNYYE